MAQLSTLPAVPWFKRLAVVLSGLLVVLGLAVFAGLLLESSPTSGLRDPWAGLRANAGACLIAYGLILLLMEFDLRRAAWAAAVPLVLSALVLIEHASGRSLGIDGLLIQDPLAGMGVSAGRMPPLLASGFFLSGIGLISMVAGIPSRLRNPALALIGSTLFAVGSATVLGYALKLPTVYTWGTPPVTARLTGVALVALGAAFMGLAWREANRRRAGAPAWLPLPVMMASATLTLVFALGLRGREVEFTGTTTEIQINGLASAINLELERQINAFDRLGRRWSESPDITETVRDVDGGAQLQECPASHSLALVNLERQTVWHYPKRNPNGTPRLRVAHPLEPARLEAMDSVRRNLGAVLSATVLQSGLGPGFAIYAPVMRNGQLNGYVAGEFTYRRFFAGLEQRLKLASHYLCSIEVGGVRVFEAGGDASSEGDAIEKVFTLHGRRIRIALAPNEEHTRLNRRFLPELALARGLRHHRFCSASPSTLPAAPAPANAPPRLSNKRLIAENEERRRVEARLKVSDERLRLALDSTADRHLRVVRQTAGHVYYSPGLWAMLGYEHARMPSTARGLAVAHPSDDLPSATDRRTDPSCNGDRHLHRSRISHARPQRRLALDLRALQIRQPPAPTAAPTRIIGTVQDITARREAEQALRESQAEARKLSLVASKTDNPVLIGADPTARIEWANESLLPRDGVLPRGSRRQTPAHFLSRPRRPIRAPCVRIRAAMDARRGHQHRRRQLLEVRPQILTSTSKSSPSAASPASWRISSPSRPTSPPASRPRTQLRRAKAGGRRRLPRQERVPRLHVARDPHADERRHRHDQSPHGDAADREQRDFVNTIRTSGEALLTIINDILDFSKIESGKMEIEHTPFDLSALHRGGPRPLRPPGRVQETRARLPHRARRARVDRRRRHAPAPDHRQPRQQRRQIHPRRQHRFHRGPPRSVRDPPCRASPNQGALRPRIHRARHRHRHPRRPPRPAVQGLQPGRLLHHPQIRRHGPRPRHLPAPQRPHGRRYPRRERSRPVARPSSSPSRPKPAPVPPESVLPALPAQTADGRSSASRTTRSPNAVSAP
jgi:PAS domain-containing protein